MSATALPPRPPRSRDRIIAPDQTWTSVGRDVTDIAFEHEGGLRWWIAFAVSLAMVGVLVVTVFWVLYEGVGAWGNNIPVTWALDIVGYDWWIGVASGGLMVSSLLLLMGAGWRGAINRVTESIALISAAAAGLYPLIHLGRSWFFFWTLPYPNTLLLYPQFRSPLFWDAVDIISFLGVCLSFWFVGMIPDLAAMRDRAIDRMERQKAEPGGWTRRLKAQLYGIAALGWRGSLTHWLRWERAYRAIAVFATILIVSVQTGAAVMFAGTVEPGWHDALAPVAFVLAALFAGVGVVAAMVVVLRMVFPLQPLITPRHLDLLAMLLLGLGLANLYCFAASFLTSALTGSDFDRAVMGRRLDGPHAWSTWAIIVCALIPVHLFWLPSLRRSPVTVCVVGLLVAFGMWANHFMVIVITLQGDFLPSMAHPYTMNLVGVGTFVGTIGLFLFLILLFVRYLPVISIVDMRRLVDMRSVTRG